MILGVTLGVVCAVPLVVMPSKIEETKMNAAKLGNIARAIFRKASRSDLALEILCGRRIRRDLVSKPRDEKLFLAAIKTNGRIWIVLDCSSVGYRVFRVPAGWRLSLLSQGGNTVNSVANDC